MTKDVRAGRRPAAVPDDEAARSAAPEQASADGMVRVRLRKAHTHAGVMLDAGAELDVPKGTAEWLAAHGVV